MRAYCITERFVLQLAQANDEHCPLTAAVIQGDSHKLGGNLMFNNLETQSVSARYYPNYRLTMVVYRGVLSPDVTAQTYGWLISLANAAPEPSSTPNSRATIFDFRDVTEFVTGNLSTVQRSSKTINTTTDLSKHAVVLLVKNLYQQQMVSVSMKVTAQEPRKRIFKTEEDALAFINRWNEQHGLTFDVAPELLTIWPTSLPA
jgi:hypothetical protein